MRPGRFQQLNALALLQTCRQVYSETSGVPYTVNTFSGNYWSLTNRHFQNLRRHQLRQIPEIRLVVCNGDLTAGGAFYARELNFLKVLPGLKRLRFSVFADTLQDQPTFEACEAHLRSYYESDLKILGVELTIETMDTTWADYHRE